MIRQKPEIRLDILITKEEDYYQAHCLQFDLVATDDTMKGAQEAISALCDAHIRFSVENDNMEYLFSPAPKEVWAAYLACLKKEGVSFNYKELKVSLEDGKYLSMIPPFMIQEVMSNDQCARRY